MAINFLGMICGLNELYRNRTVCVRYRTDKLSNYLINYWEPKGNRLAHCCVIDKYEFFECYVCHPVFLGGLVIKDTGWFFRNGT